MNRTALHIPPTGINYPSGNSMILLFGIYYPMTEKFTMEFAWKLYERYKLRFRKKVIKTKSRKLVKRYNVLSSKGDKRYIVVHNVIGNIWNCNCKSFFYRKRCRHIKEAQDGQRSCG